MEHPRPHVGVGVFVIGDNSRILLGKRKNSHGASTWSLPGGHLEFGETFEDCARREVMEETSLSVEGISYAATTNDIFRKENRHYVTIFMRCEKVTGTPKVMEPDKCESWQWFSWNRLPEPLFLPLDNLKKTGFTPY